MIYYRAGVSFDHMIIRSHFDPSPNGIFDLIIKGNFYPLQRSTALSDHRITKAQFYPEKELTRFCDHQATFRFIFKRKTLDHVTIHRSNFHKEFA